MPDVDRYLEELEERIDPEVEEDFLAQWLDFTWNRFSGDVFNPKRKCTAQPKIQWLAISVNQALHDMDMMILQQYYAASENLSHPDGLFMCVRGNYGSSILPILFGVEPFVMEDRFDTLPTSRPLPHGLDDVRRLLDKGVPDAFHDIAGKALGVGRRFVEIGKKYPKIGKYVHLYHPDAQGPMDVAEVVVGSRIFLDAYDEPQLIKDFLDLITQTYIAYMKEWFTIVPPKEGGWSVHWAMMHGGNIVLRDDSAMNFSPEMYAEFIFPYDQRLLDEFGGGAIHFCGRGDHFIEKMSETMGYHAQIMSQPELNDMEMILRNTVDKGIKLLAFNHVHLDQILASGRELHGQLHSIIPSISNDQEE